MVEAERNEVGAKADASFSNQAVVMAERSLRFQNMMDWLCKNGESRGELRGAKVKVHTHLVDNHIGGRDVGLAEVTRGLAGIRWKMSTILSM